jgi:hypothetical protein
MQGVNVVHQNSNLRLFVFLYKMSRRCWSLKCELLCWIPSVASSGFVGPQKWIKVILNDVRYAHFVCGSVAPPTPQVYMCSPLHLVKVRSRSRVRANVRAAELKASLHVRPSVTTGPWYLSPKKYKELPTADGQHLIQWQTLSSESIQRHSCTLTLLSICYVTYASFRFLFALISRWPISGNNNGDNILTFGDSHVDCM